MKTSTQRLWIHLLVCATGCAWVAWCASIPISEIIETRFGEQITGILKLRTYDASQFLANRFYDVAMMVTALCGLIGVMLACGRRLPQTLPKGWSVIVLSILGFVCANLFTLALMQTVTYWLALHVAGPDYRLPCVSSEWLMLEESQAQTRGILMGSSQAPAQVDVRELNQAFKPNVQFANLSYIGSEPLDFLMQQNYLRTFPDVAVCYLSEMSFYRGVSDWHALTLASRQSAQDLEEFGGSEHFTSLSKRYGRLSRSLPIFRCRRGIESALFGVAGPPPVSSRLSKTEQDLEAAREQGLNEFLSEFRYDESNDVQKAALAKLVENFRLQGTQVVLIAGSMNELVGDRIDPVYRKDMLQFLSEVNVKFDNVRLAVEGEQLPRATSAQYRDMTHLAEENRPWYTSKVAEYLATEFGWSMN